MTVQDTITDLVLETFRLNGRLLASGDALVADLGLTSARWQVIGAIALSPVPLSVAQIARNMGLTRQAVQRLANEMEADGLVRFAPGSTDPATLEAVRAQSASPARQARRAHSRGQDRFRGRHETPGRVGDRPRRRPRRAENRRRRRHAAERPATSRK